MGSRMSTVTKLKQGWDNKKEIIEEHVLLKNNLKHRGKVELRITCDTTMKKHK